MLTRLFGNIVELELDFIEVNPFQPRTSFNEEQLRELASSIREFGGYSAHHSAQTGL